MMRRLSSCSLLVLISTVTLSVIPTAARSDYVLSQISPKLSISGSVRLRGEFWDWFASHGPQNSNYNFFGSVARGMVSWKDDAFDVVFEGQNSSLANLPDESVAPAPQGPLGLGAVYF